VVQIPHPPPTPPDGLEPLLFELPKGKYLARIYKINQDYECGPLIFRFHGPRERFDHQYADQAGKAQKSPDRGVYYASPVLSSEIDALSCCLSECFGDDNRVIELLNRKFCRLNVVRPLMLLDLRGDGAMRIGACYALSGCIDRPLSQAWSRYIYENELDFTLVDGIIYPAAHNGDAAMALYERAIDSFELDSDLHLNDPELIDHIKFIALRLRLILPLDQWL
jgi:RES domain